MRGQDKLDGDVIKRLNILIMLALEHLSVKSAQSITEKIYKLNDLDVNSVDIARILGKQPNYVTAVLSRRKPRKKEG